MCKIWRWLTILLTMQIVSGCGYIKSLFPDKERDYQFRTEIPELIVPEDLKARTLPDRTLEQVAAAAVSAAEPVAEAPLANEQAMQVPSSTKQAQPEVEATDDNKPALPIAIGNTTVSSLQVDQPRNQAGRLVGRALSRQRIEVVERNLDKGFFYVKYDPHATKPKDGTIWDEITFLFGEDPSNEQEYRISLLEIAPQVTEVTVQNSEGQTLSNEVATALLKLITDGINQGLSESTPESAPDNVSAP